MQNGLPPFPENQLVGKIYYRNAESSFADVGADGKTPSVYLRHAYQYGTTSAPVGSALPSAVIFASCENDIKVCIQYANENNIALAVRSGGHQYLAYSSTMGKNIQVDLMGVEFEGKREDFPFTQTSYDEEKNLFTCGVGISVQELNYEMSKFGLWVAHGECGAVRIGGHSQTGGYSGMSRTVGLMVDYIHAYEIILADGQTHLVSRDSLNQDELDLFYAIAGGSPGNFGILTKVVLRPKKNSDFTAHGCKFTYRYSKTRIRQLLELVENLQQADTKFGYEFSVNVMALSHEYGQHDNHDLENRMRAQFPDLFGSSMQMFYPFSTCLINAAVIREGKNLPVTPLMKEFFELIDRALVVEGELWNFPLPDLSMVPRACTNLLLCGLGYEMPSYESVEKYAVENAKEGATVTSIRYTDLVTLKNGTKVPQTVGWLNLQWMFLNITSVRAFPRPFQKRLWLADTKSNLRQQKFAEWASERIDFLVNEEGQKYDNKLAFQCFALGGENSKFNNPPDNKTSAAFRDSTSLCGLDSFFNPSSPESQDFGRAWCEENDRQGLGPKGRYSNQERKILWAPYGSNSLDEEHLNYFDSETTYQRVLKVKRRVDPNHLFTPNLFCVGAMDSVEVQRKANGHSTPAPPSSTTNVHKHGDAVLSKIHMETFVKAKAPAPPPSSSCAVS